MSDNKSYVDTQSQFQTSPSHEDSGERSLASVLASRHRCDDDLPGQPRVSLVGTEAGEFRIVKECGEGGMGVVYRAEQARLGNRPVAVKVINPGIAGEREALAKFVKEPKHLALLAHENVVQVYTTGQIGDNGTLFIAMEWVEGETLRKYLSKPHSVDHVLDCIEQVLAGLAYAHAKDIIHRDIKPDNVMVVTAEDERPRVKVIDFGLAALLSDDRGGPPLSYVGTRGYMAPEIRRGEAAKFASDVYSVGVMLDEAIARYRVLKEVRAVARKAQQPNPDNRYQDAKGMLMALRLAREAPKRRNRRLVVGTVVALCLVLLAIPFYLLYQRQEKARMLSWRQAEIEKSNELASLAGTSTDPVWMLNYGLQAIRAAPTDPPKRAISILQEGLHRTQRYLGEWHTKINRVAFTPNGQSVITMDCDGAARFWNLSGKLEKRLDHQHECIDDVLFSSDGSKIFTVSKQGIVAHDDKAEVVLDARSSGRRIVRAAVNQQEEIVYVATDRESNVNVNVVAAEAGRGGTMLYVAFMGPGSFRDAAFSPDARSVIIGLNRGAMLARIDGTPDPLERIDSEGMSVGYAVGTPPPQMLLRDEGAVNSVSFSPDGNRFVTAGDDRTVRAWFRSWYVDGREIGSRTGSARKAWFTPDGKKILVLDKERSPWIWDVTTGGKASFSPPRGLQDPANALASSADGVVVLTAHNRGNPLLWLSDGTFFKALNAPSQSHVHSAAFGAGSVLVTASEKNAVFRRINESDFAILGASTTLMESNCPEADYSVTTPVAISGDARMVVTAEGRQVMFWRDSGQLQHDSRLGQSIYTVAFDNQARRAVAVDGNGIATVFDVSTGIRTITSFKAEYGFQMEATFVKQGSSIVVKGDDTISVWNIQTGTRQSILWRFNAKESIRTLTAVSASTDRVVASTSEGTVLWNLAGGGRRVLLPPDNLLTGATFTPDGTLLALITQRRQLQLLSGDGARVLQGWDLSSSPWAELFSPGDDAPSTWPGISPIHLSPNNRQILICLGGHAVLAPLKQGETVELPGVQCLTRVSFSPDGERFATFSYGLIRVWTADGRQMFEVPGEFLDARFTPDGRYLVAVSKGHEIHRYPLGTADIIAEAQATLQKIDPAVLKFRTQPSPR